MNSVAIASELAHSLLCGLAQGTISKDDAVLLTWDIAHVSANALDNVTKMLLPEATTPFHRCSYEEAVFFEVVYEHHRPSLTSATYHALSALMGRTRPGKRTATTSFHAVIPELSEELRARWDAKRSKSVSGSDVDGTLPVPSANNVDVQVDTPQSQTTGNLSAQFPDLVSELRSACEASNANAIANVVDGRTWAMCMEEIPEDELKGKLGVLHGISDEAAASVLQPLISGRWTVHAASSLLRHFVLPLIFGLQRPCSRLLYDALASAQQSYSRAFLDDALVSVFARAPTFAAPQSELVCRMLKEHYKSPEVHRFLVQALEKHQPQAEASEFHFICMQQAIAAAGSELREEDVCKLLKWLETMAATEKFAKSLKYATLLSRLVNHHAALCRQHSERLKQLLSANSTVLSKGALKKVAAWIG